MDWLAGRYLCEEMAILVDKSPGDGVCNNLLARLDIVLGNTSCIVLLYDADELMAS